MTWNPNPITPTDLRTPPVKAPSCGWRGNVIGIIAFGTICLIGGLSGPWSSDPATGLSGPSSPLAAVAIIAVVAVWAWLNGQLDKAKED
jgi:hypothetical protein